MNFLKSLELQGFKSFANKTVFQFPARVTAVVGPNGSGKSNVIDAIRWALGEREAKSLRGNTLSNLIFAGTTKKAPFSFARVSLCFDNRDKVFPFDGEEVEISRRVDRSGNSRFFIYDSEVRLKDLLPILSRARLGAKGLTIIGQGQSDVFIKSSPQERRVMIEEMLGLKEFRLKKVQSENRLQSSKNNLEKVSAMLEELEPRLRFLKKQKKRWERRFEVEEELKKLENHYFSVRYIKARDELSKTSPDVSSLESEQKDLEKKIAALEKEVESASFGKNEEEEIKKWRRIREEIALKRSGLEKDLVRLETKMEFFKTGEEKSVSTEEVIAKAKAAVRKIRDLISLEDIGELKKGLEVLVKELEEAVSPSQKGSEPHNEFREDMERINKEIKEYDDKLGEAKDKEEEFLMKEREINKEFREKVARLEARKNELREIERRIQEKSLSLQRQRLYMEELEREWRAIGREIGELRSLKKSEDIPDDDLGSIEKRMNRLRGELFSIGEIEESVVKEAREVEERHEFLHRELSDLEKAKADLENLITSLEERIHREFRESFKIINNEFNNYFRLMFKGGKAKLKLEKVTVREPENGEGLEEEAGQEEEENRQETGKKGDFEAGVEIELNLPNKKTTTLDMLSGGERSLVSIAALFSFIAVNPPFFLVLDEIDAALDEDNAERFAKLVEEFSAKTQFIIVTHNRATMEKAQALYGVTMEESGISKVLSLKLE